MARSRTAEQTRQLFDQWAETYDQSVAYAGGPLTGYASSLEEAANAILVCNGDQVLDIGIGTGAFAVLLEAKGAIISGVDVSDRMLATCREKHPAYTLRVGGFTPILMDDSRFDIIISSFAFHEVPTADRKQACAEIWRVLKPGGTICLLDIMFASVAAVDEAERLIGSQWDDAEDYALVGDLDTLLRSAGFGALRWKQTAPCHWFVVGRKASHKVSVQN